MYILPSHSSIIILHTYYRFVPYVPATDLNLVAVELRTPRGAQAQVPLHGPLMTALRCVRAAAFLSHGTVHLKGRHRSTESDIIAVIVEV